MRLRFASLRTLALIAGLLANYPLLAAGPCGGGGMGMGGGRGMGGGGGMGAGGMGMSMGMGSGMGGNCSSGQTGMQQNNRNSLQSTSNVSQTPFYYVPLMIPQAGTYTPPAASVTPVSYNSTNMQPSPSVRSEPTASAAPSEAPNHLLYVEVAVKGIERNRDSDRLATALDKLDGSRGASVKRNQAGGATVKVWYSEKEPVSADAVKDAVEKLGFKAAPIGG